MGFPWHIYIYIYLKRLRPFRRPLKRRRIIRFVTSQNECQLSCNLGLEGIEIFMVSTFFSGLLHHEDSWLRCFEIVPKSLYNLPNSFKNRLKNVVCGGGLVASGGGLGAFWGVLERSWGDLEAILDELGTPYEKKKFRQGCISQNALKNDTCAWTPNKIQLGNSRQVGGDGKSW